MYENDMAKFHNFPCIYLKLAVTPDIARNIYWYVYAMWVWIGC